MGNLMKTEDREIKTVRRKDKSEKLASIRNRISDESYIDQAILEIATELSHYLTK